MRDVRVRDIRWEAEGVVSLGLVDPSGAPMGDWSAGTHLGFELQPGLERQYSLCGDIGDRDEWRVAVLREPESKGGSAWVHEQLRPGDILRVRDPRNDFPLQAAEAYQFIAGGIGVTPILPMLATATAGGTPWRLLYGGRQRDSMAFLSQIEAYGDRATVVPQDESGMLDLATTLGDWKPGTAVYCCGPAPLIAAVEEQCDALGLPQGTLRVERFTPLVDAETARVGDGFEVQLERSGLTVQVADGQTIVEAVEAAGVEVECSCLEGVCGTCETAVLDGVPDHRDSLLTEAEREANDTMMICVSRALSPTLRLDL